MGDEGGGESCDDSRIIGSEWPGMSDRSVRALVVRRKVGAEAADEASCCDDKGSVGPWVRKTAFFLEGSRLGGAVGASRKEEAVDGQTSVKTKRD
jgi:hypothetical protein